MKRKNNNTALKWIYQVSGGGKKWILLLLAVRVLQAITNVQFALSLGDVVDSAVAGDTEAFIRMLMLFLALVLALLLLYGIGRYLTEKASVLLEKNFRMRLFRQMMDRNYADVTAMHTGEWMNRFSSDVQTVVNALVQIFPGFSGMAVRLVSAAWVMMKLLPQMVWILVPGFAAISGVSLLVRGKLKSLHKKAQEADGNVRSFVQERLGGLLVVHSFTQEEASLLQAEEKMDQRISAQMRRVRYANLCNVAMHTAMQLARVLCIGLCSWGILQGAMSYGTMSAALQLVSQLEVPIANIASYFPQYYAMIASAERLMEVEQYEPDCDTPPVSAADALEYYRNDFAAVGLEDVCFAYRGLEEPVLKNLSFRLEKGKFVAFTGESGCGKSTALKMLLSLYRLQGGQGYLENRDGSRLPLTAAWRSLYAYVPQGNQIISGTIRQTLTFADPELMKQEAAIQKALEVACADGFIAELPNGLDTMLGERGAGLSEGQMQRLSIARAVLSQRPILLLDEATSALDGPTEEQVLQNLRTMTDRTVLIITHREAALSICDRRIHFEKEEL